MKCKLLSEKEVLEFHPGTDTPFAPPELVNQCVRRGKLLFAPAGTIIDDPECWRIVLLGQAEAVDDDCKAATAQTIAQRASALKAAKRLAAGILPGDAAKFDAGEILGYAADGTYIRGPNWKEPKPAATEDDDE